jgi:hypothetical protein
MMNRILDNQEFRTAVKTFWPVAKEAISQGREIKDDLPALQRLINALLAIWRNWVSMWPTTWA